MREEPPRGAVVGEDGPEVVRFDGPVLLIPFGLPDDDDLGEPEDSE